MKILSIIASWQVFGRVVLPVTLSVSLFTALFFFQIVPNVETVIMNGKREMIKELTEVAYQEIASFDQKAKSWAMTEDEAKAAAKERIRSIRYGEDQKDYFWINDLTPKMVMHPYRSDLEGQNLSNFADPLGKLLFMEFIKAVNDGKFGYVDYMWQWKDDSKKVVPKISYVKVYEPWGWIIGTGIYVEDVNAKIASIKARMLKVGFVVLAILSALSVYSIFLAVRSEQKRLELNKKKDDFVGIASHELRTPLTAIRGYLSMMVDGDFWKIENEELMTAIRTIDTSSERLLRLVNDMLDIEKLESGKMIFYPSEFKVCEALLRISKENERYAGKTKMTISCELEEGIFINTDEGKFQQVLTNLVGNAIKYGKKKGHVRLVCRSVPHELVRVEVIDDGPGILPEDRERIFTKFVQSDDSLSKKHSGTGLGLAIVREIVRRMDSEIKLESEVGKGSKFYFDLPIARYEKPNETKKKA